MSEPEMSTKAIRQRLTGELKCYGSPVDAMAADIDWLLRRVDSLEAVVESAPPVLEAAAKAYSQKLAPVPAWEDPEDFCDEDD